MEEDKSQEESVRDAAVVEEEKVKKEAATVEEGGKEKEGAVVEEDKDREKEMSEDELEGGEELPDETMRHPGVRFFVMPLDHAMQNAEHDEPGYWKRWAESF